MLTIMIAFSCSQGMGLCWSVSFTMMGRGKRWMWPPTPCCNSNGCTIPLKMHSKHLKRLLPRTLHLLVLHVLIAHVFCSAQSSKPGVPGTVRFSVLAPLNRESHEQTMQTILPSIELAVLHVADPKNGRLPGWNIKLTYKNTNCSSTDGPMAAFDLHNQSGE